MIYFFFINLPCVANKECTEERLEKIGRLWERKAGAELQGYRSGMGVFEGTTAGGRLAREEREEVGKITGPPLPLSRRQFYQRGCDEALKAFQQELCDCAHVLFTCTCTDSCAEIRHGVRAWLSARFRLCICTSDGRAGCYSTSHSKWWRCGVRAAGRQRDRQLFPPHISVQRHHQSLAEMSVLQAGDRPLNVSPSQVNIQSQPALQTGMGGEWGQGVDEDNKRKHGDSD